uniref:Ubiquitin carboxyl-terminal hydrolase 30 n=1 Tax=Tetraodon nigroviridis TaxID=99883 RepID=H3DEL6_TETNG
SSDKLIVEFLGSGHIVGETRVTRNWGVIGGIAAAIAAGVFIWGPITEKRKKKKGMVPGLLNLGNTFFLNSFLQGLAACPSFICWREKILDSCARDNQLSSTLLQLLKALSNDEPGEEDLLDAGCLLDILRLYRWHISSSEEQDAHELFHVLTSSLEEERERLPKVPHFFDMPSLETPSVQEQTMACISRAPLHPIPNPWKFQHPFHGRLTSNMLCKRCGHQSPVRYDSFESLSLSIPLPQWGRPVTLDQCLQHFISSETIKEVECESCTKLHQDTAVNENAPESQRSTIVKQLKLGKLPQCLCIHLQRLTWSSEGTLKRQEHVQFSEYLSMDSYKHNASTGRRTRHAPNPTQTENLGGSAGKQTITTGDHQNNNFFSNGTCSSVFFHSPGVNPQLSLAYDCSPSQYLFQLTAVLVHHGDMHSGHFVTYRRSPSPPHLAFSSQWLWVSDDSVRKASLQEVLSSNAYMLFYERVQRLNLALHTEE